MLSCAPLLLYRKTKSFFSTSGHAFPPNHSPADDTGMCSTPSLHSFGISPSPSEPSSVITSRWIACRNFTLSGNAWSLPENFRASTQPIFVNSWHHWEESFKRIHCEHHSRTRKRIGRAICSSSFVLHYQIKCSQGTAHQWSLGLFSYTVLQRWRFMVCSDQSPLILYLAVPRLARSTLTTLPKPRALISAISSARKNE